MDRLLHAHANVFGELLSVELGERAEDVVEAGYLWECGTVGSVLGHRAFASALSICAVGVCGVIWRPFGPACDVSRRTSR